MKKEDFLAAVLVLGFGEQFKEEIENAQINNESNVNSIVNTSNTSRLATEE